MPRLTASGLMLIGGIAISSMLGLAGGVRELLILAVAATAALLTELFWLAAQPRKLKATLDHGQQPPTAGIPIQVTMSIENPSRIRSLPGTITIGTTQVDSPLPLLRGNNQTTLEATLPGSRRGWLLLSPISLRTLGPFGFTERLLNVETPSKFLVRPPVTVFDTSADLGGVDPKIVGAGHGQGHEDREFTEVREFQPGDEIRHVHWPSTARTGVPVVRQYDGTGGGNIHLVCDLGSDEDDEARERSVQLAASITLALIDKGATVLLQCSGDMAAVVSGRNGADQALDILAAADESDLAPFDPSGVDSQARGTAVVCTPNRMTAQSVLVAEHDLEPIVICTSADDRLGLPALSFGPGAHMDAVWADLTNRKPQNIL